MCPAFVPQLLLFEMEPWRCTRIDLLQVRKLVGTKTSADLPFSSLFNSSFPLENLMRTMDGFLAPQEPHQQVHVHQYLGTCPPSCPSFPRPRTENCGTNGWMAECRFRPLTEYQYGRSSCFFLSELAGAHDIAGPHGMWESKTVKKLPTVISMCGFNNS
jgi:hypothetical protein